MLNKIETRNEKKKNLEEHRSTSFVPILSIFGNENVPLVASLKKKKRSYNASLPVKLKDYVHLLVRLRTRSNAINAVFVNFLYLYNFPKVH